MAKFQIIAHAMHETELDLAEPLIAHANRTRSFVSGVVDEEKIDQLEKAGLIVEKVREVSDDGQAVAHPRPETPGTGARIPRLNAVRSLSFSTESVAVSPDLDLTKPNVYLIQIRGPVLQDWKDQLNGAGVHLLQSYQDNCYSAFLSPDQLAKVRAFKFIERVFLYDAQHTAPGAAANLKPLGESVQQQDIRQMKTFDVRLHRPEDAQKVLAWLKQQNVAVAGASGGKVRIYVLERSPVLGQIAALPEVKRFEEYVPPVLFNDRARGLMRLEKANAPVITYKGKGQIVGIADTGIDDTHPDFRGRIRQAIARGRQTADDPAGHGTHVAGSVLGDGTASGGSYKGVAPEAELVFQSLLDAGGNLGGLPLDLNTLFDEAYQAGARIHNNSWGAITLSTYTMNSGEVDEFVAKKRDMLIVIAAGNAGSAANPVNTGGQKGIVDWLSIGSPATAKNALTVGACRTDRTDGALSTRRWGEAWAQSFPDPPIADENVSGNPDCMAAFSSRGPSDDRRIKPDLVAPGTDIISAKSKLAPIQNFWGPVKDTSAYAYDGGTSMATPLVAGCAALVRQFYQEDRQHANPSAALLRATLINGTRWLPGADANASNPAGLTPAANFDQGFGCVNMETTLPNPQQPKLALVFVDNWQSPGDQLAVTGDQRRYLLQVNGGTPLRICLTYTDAPGRALQNNLNLFVQLPDNTKLVGNFQLRQSLNIPDVDNNVEVVRIPDPKAGSYLIQISATNLLHSPQDFALVVTGDLGAGGLQAI